MTTSFPFLAIAEKFGVPYGDVIRCAEFMEHGGGFKTHLGQYEGAAIIGHAVLTAIHQEAARRRGLPC